ncbi:DNA polymerase III subunit theta [Providencia rettgeri]|uniref:DNA polymerase III subunit theta n=1 Tax=Providencia rettgeri TaxID=587 RepID=UPI0005B2FC67
MGHNLAELSKEEMDKVNVDLAASAVAYKERLNKVEQEQPEHLREYFRERLAHYRKLSETLPGAGYYATLDSKAQQ